MNEIKKVSTKIKKIELDERCVTNNYSYRFYVASRDREDNCEKQIKRIANRMKMLISNLPRTYITIFESEKRFDGTWWIGDIYILVKETIK